jgi:hypothetical protein
VHEGIRLAVIAGDEAEALHRVEELDRALARSPVSSRCGALRAWLHGDHVANDLEIAAPNLAAAIHQVELQLLTFGQAFKPGAFNRADVDEHVFAAPSCWMKPKPFWPLKNLTVPLPVPTTWAGIPPPPPPPPRRRSRHRHRRRRHAAAAEAAAAAASLGKGERIHTGAIRGPLV